jgi:hypothetical protein
LFLLLLPGRGSLSGRLLPNMQAGSRKDASHHRSHKGIESDINRNRHENAKKKFPGEKPAKENGC